ncbi:MAG: transposase [Candidatus Coatesbacteria bacterium]|nr:transposase [Candidatus Coatesbacteria bacterium]
MQESINSYFWFYNEIRPHQSLNYRTPDEVYGEENGSINNHKSFYLRKRMIVGSGNVTH